MEIQKVLVMGCKTRSSAIAAALTAANIQVVHVDGQSVNDGATETRVMEALNGRWTEKSLRLVPPQNPYGPRAKGRGGKERKW